MALMLTNDPISQKTRELCQLIIDQPDFRALRERIDTFMADTEAKSQYRTVVEKGEALNHKQHQGVVLADTEIADFEREREALVNNPVARDFLDAQEALHQLQESVNQYLTKTFELGRVPSEEDFGGNCGHGCGCHH